MPFQSLIQLIWTWLRAGIWSICGSKNILVIITHTLYVMTIIEDKKEYRFHNYKNYS